MTSIPELRSSESQASETAGAGPQVIRGFDFDLGALGAGPASERIARRDPIPRPLRVIAGWSWRMLLIFAALVVAGRLVRQVWEIVLPLVLGLFLAAVLEPVAAALRRRGVPALLAAVLVFLSAMAVIVSVLTWIVTTVSGEFADLSGQLREARVELERWAQGPPLRLSGTQLARVTDQIEQAVQGVSSDGALADAAGTARSVVTVLSGAVLALFVLFFLLKDGETIGAWMLDRTPIRFRDDVSAISSSVRNVMRKYLSATAMTGVIDAVLIGVGLAIVGVPLVLPLAMLAFIGGFFPFIGATAAGLLAALVALVAGGVGDALIVVAITVFVQQLEGNVLQPILLERAVKLHALVTIFAVAGGLLVGGLAGAFLAVPVVASVSAAAGHYRRRSLRENPAILRAGDVNPSSG